MEIHSNRFFDENCDFCVEIKDFKSSTFADTYGQLQRVIYSDQYFCVMPTIGQLFMCSLLILPKKHYYSFAEIPPELIKHLNSIIDHFEKQLINFGNVVLFEHGTTPEIGGGCGIYHAHIHMLPVPSNMPPEFLLKSSYNFVSNLEEALITAGQKKNYLMYRDIDKNYYVTATSTKLQSQHFRKKLHEYFCLKSPWDWRKFKYEDKLVDTLNYFKNQNNVKNSNIGLHA